MADERIYVALKAYLGDAVMAGPMFDALTARSHVTVSTAPFVQPILWRPQGAPDLVPMIRQRAPWSVVQHARSLRKHRFTTAVLINRAFRAAVIARLAGIPRRIGHASEGRNGLLTDVVPFDEDKFEAYCSLDLARAIAPEIADVRPVLPVTEAERRRGEELAGPGVIAFQPGARFPEKQLPFSVTVEIASALQRDGHGIVLVGGPEERGDAQRLAEALPQPVVDLVGKTSLRETIGTLSTLRAAVGADTGVMHMAAASGCPTVTIFGPTPALKWGHTYGPHQVLRAPNDRMAEVSAETILSAVREVLGQA